MITTAVYATAALLLLRFILSLRFLLPAARRRRYKIPRQNEYMQENPLYRKAMAYISSLASLEDSQNANIFSAGGRLYLRPEKGSSVHDWFLGAPLTWTVDSDQALILTLPAQHRRILRAYLGQVESTPDEPRLYANSAAGCWAWSPFSHPATFDSLAIDVELKNRLKADLESFAKGKAFYRRLGKVWKRSYLLSGAPGTGKSSVAAAMANLLRYDVYDLDLGQVGDAAAARAMVLSASPRSVILVEDVDRFDGGLGFLDAVGEERVVVLTTREKKEEMGRGRVDVVVHLPLCDFAGFKAMAGSYLGIKDHKLYSQVEEMFRAGAAISHGEIGEMMIAGRGSPSRAIRTVIGALQRQNVGPPIFTPVEERDLQSCDKSGALKEGALKDIRKFYSLLKLRGAIRKDVTHSPADSEKDRSSDRS
ncbi:AAA-ATPase At2g46620-like [Wolffia australiana]